MPVFEYEGLSNSGKALRGIIDAESMRTARSKLRSQGVYPTEIREEAVAVALSGPSFRLFSGVPPKELARVFRQLATLVGAGIPLVSSISALIDQTGHSILRKVLTRIRESVREGGSLADALAAHPQVFPPILVGLVRAGEVSGALGLTLGRWADFSEHQVALRQRVRAALTYPVFMFFIGAGVLFFLMAFVVPTVTRVFSDLGQSLLDNAAFAGDKIVPKDPRWVVVDVIGRYVFCVVRTPTATVAVSFLLNKPNLFGVEHHKRPLLFVRCKIL